MAQACGRRRRGRGDKLVGEVCDAVDSARKHCLPLPTLSTCPPAQPLRRARYAGCGLVTGQPAPTSGLALMTLTARFSDSLTAGGPRIRPSADAGDALVHVQQQENSSFGRERRRRCPTRRRALQSAGMPAARPHAR